MAMRLPVGSRVNPMVVVLPVVWPDESEQAGQMIVSHALRHVDTRASTSCTQFWPLLALILL